ncbi:DMT family transporter [Flavobacterium sp. TAB 87]|uniref:DMT family transporter n=1 Tax=Flavobacterium sp. TAB 87 TaxID=1729581 RepID=UPI00076D044A|nr:DMT family transporter [Flavobacterium sp. TAB 87]KVV16111.1 EamA-like transporter family protein [Flavobacterium sp. TAB 87]
MLYLILSIICSVSVGIIFKISRKYENNNFQIVLFNYFFAMLFCLFAFEPTLRAIDENAPFVVYGSLGILLPVVFMFLIASIKNIGIVKTDAAQRLSLFIPILAAWFIFKEEFTTSKIIGILFGFLALFCILSKIKESSQSSWKYPLLVFLGFGVIDILFKKIAIYTFVPYTTSLFMVFAIAFLIMAIVVLYQQLIKKEVFNFKNLLFGFLVGLFNFGNILFYLKAHHAFSENPSTVFAGMNMGVIILGSLAGVIAFKEKLSKLNYVGLLLALISIVLIVFAQFK